MRRASPFYLSEVRQIRAVASPLRAAVIDVLEVLGPASIAQLATALGYPPDGIYYHVGILERIGLVVRTTPDTDTGAARFALPGRPATLRYRLDDRQQGRAIAKVVATMLRSAERSFRGAFASGLAEAEGPGRNLRAGRRTAWLTGSELRVLNRHVERIHALFGRGRPGRRGARLHEFTYVLAPVIEKHREKHREKRRRRREKLQEKPRARQERHRSAEAAHEAWRSRARPVLSRLWCGRAAVQQQQRSPGGGTSRDPVRAVANRHIILKVSVNRSRPLSFVLDTGANSAIIRMSVAKELHLALQGSVNATGAGAGSQAGSRVEDATWSLVGLERFTQPVSLALPLPDLPSALGRDVDGIVGGEFIKQFVVELDYQARLIRLHNRATFAYQGRGEVLPLDLNSNGHPVVKAIVTPAAGTPLEQRFLLDIGSGLALALHSPFVIEQRLLDSPSPTIRVIGTAGAGGRSVGRLGRVAALQIGSFTIKNPITLFSQDQAGAFANRSLAGNIGAQIASRFRTFLDYGRRRIILEPSPTFAEPFDRAFSGIALRAEGADYRVFRIREVLEESPAD